MFNMFSSYGRYSSYRPESSDEEEAPAAFALSSGTGRANTALEAALAADPSAGRIDLETEQDGMDVDAAVAASAQHLCVECRDQPATRTCAQCADNYCSVCYAAMHKRGTRATHTHTPYAAGTQLDAMVSGTGESAAPAPAVIPSSPVDEEKDGAEAMDESNTPAASSSTAAASSSSATAAPAAATAESEADSDDDVTDDDLEDAYMRGRPAAAAASSAASAAPAAARTATDALSETDSDDADSEDDRSTRSGASSASGRIVLPSNAMNSSLLGGGIIAGRLPVDWFLNRAKAIPLRLTLDERKMLRLLESTLHVSEYTDKIDIISSKDKMGRIKEQLRDLCSILSGLVVASDYKLGQKLIKDKDFEENADFFRNVFELGRRHKIRNPEKMRNNYGKLVYIIQDSVDPRIEELMGFNLFSPLQTVYRRLESAGALDCLRDERMMIATGDIKTEGRQRPEIERDIKTKEGAVTYLAKRYMNQQIDEDGMRACILSVADNHTYLIQNRHCCDQMSQWLTECYSATEPQAPWSLAILGGRAGARLTHSHANQFSYVLQSLTLWREVLHDSYALWVNTEEDLFDSTNPYRLRNTGQGLNRVQPAPRVGRTMHNILAHCQRKLGNWVGSSVIHLGDHNVPNALNFIDKYSQVSRILNPIVLVIKAIPRLCEKKDLKFYIDTIFGGPEKLKLLILTDFFRHAFDGSGADNFFDAGSCIDGRLTSAWNWCSKLEKKSFYTIFQLAGFSSFDGQWSD